MRTAKRCCALLSLTYRYGNVIISATSVTLDNDVEIIAACVCPIFIQQSFYLATKEIVKNDCLLYAQSMVCKVGQMKKAPKNKVVCDLLSSIYFSCVMRCSNETELLFVSI